MPFAPSPARIAAVLAIAFGLAAPAATAQNFLDRLGRTIERAAESEVHRQADRRTRQATRCALGDERCIAEARRQGHEVEVTGGGGAGTGTASSVDPGGDHPLIVPYAGSQRCAREYSDYDEATRVIGKENRLNVTETLEGRYTRLCYTNPDGRSVFEVFRNYRDALVSRGLQVEYECSGPDACSNFNVRGVALGDVMKIGRFQSSNQRDQRYLTGRMARDGGTTFVSLQTYPPYTLIHVVETDEMDTGMVSVNADALSAGLERDGKVTLEGIYFDTGRDTLRSESDPALAQVGLLLRDQPALNLLVVGHTDSTGSADANVRLSQRRAERVRDALVTRYGVAPARLTAQGVGAATPVASNDTEQGRQQNRRVELVRR